MSAFGSASSAQEIANGVYCLKVKRGVKGNRQWLSCHEDGSRLDLWHRDDDSGRQKFCLQQIGIEDGCPVMCVTVVFGLSNMRANFLSCTRDGKVDLYGGDDNSGRQKWVFISIGRNGHDMMYNIRPLRGTNRDRTYLSCTDDGRCVDLWCKDDGSWRQRWALYPVEEPMVAKKPCLIEKWQAGERVGLVRQHKCLMLPWSRRKDDKRPVIISCQFYPTAKSKHIQTGDESQAVLTQWKTRSDIIDPIVNWIGQCSNDMVVGETRSGEPYWQVQTIKLFPNEFSKEWHPKKEEEKDGPLDRSDKAPDCDGDPNLCPYGRDGGPKCWRVRYRQYLERIAQDGVFLQIAPEAKLGEGQRQEQEWALKAGIDIWHTMDGRHFFQGLSGKS